jgi:hypothetical protein
LVHILGVVALPVRVVSVVPVRVLTGNGVGDGVVGNVRGGTNGTHRVWSEQPKRFNFFNSPCFKIANFSFGNFPLFDYRHLSLVSGR